MQICWKCYLSHLGQLTQTDQSDIPYHVMSCSVRKQWGKLSGVQHSELAGQVVSYCTVHHLFCVLHQHLPYTIYIMTGSRTFQYIPINDHDLSCLLIYIHR